MGSQNTSQQKKLKLQTFFQCVLPTLLFIVQVYFDIVSKSNSYVFPKVGLARCLNGLLMKKLHFDHNNVTIAQRLFKEQCVVPENIHTPPTEGCLQFEPPPPRIFRSRGLRVAPPYPLEFP